MTNIKVIRGGEVWKPKIIENREVELNNDYLLWHGQWRLGLPSGTREDYYMTSRDIAYSFYYLQQFNASLFNPPLDILSYWWGGSYAPAHIPPRSFDIQLVDASIFIKRIYDGWKYTGEIDLDIIGMSANPGDVRNTRRHNFVWSIPNIPAFNVYDRDDNWGKGFWRKNDFDTNDAVILKDEFFTWGLRIKQRNFQTSGQIQLFTLNLVFKKL